MGVCIFNHLLRRSLGPEYCLELRLWQVICLQTCTLCHSPLHFSVTLHLISTPHPQVSRTRVAHACLWTPYRLSQPTLKCPVWQPVQWDLQGQQPGIRRKDTEQESVNSCWWITLWYLCPLSKDRSRASASYRTLAMTLLLGALIMSQALFWPGLGVNMAWTWQQVHRVTESFKWHDACEVLTTVP